MRLLRKEGGTAQHTVNLLLHLLLYIRIFAHVIDHPCNRVGGGVLACQEQSKNIAVNFIITLAFAILGRAVPNMNVLLLSFGVRIFVGFSVLIFVFIVMVQFLLGMIEDTPNRMLQFLPFY